MSVLIAHVAADEARATRLMQQLSDTTRQIRLRNIEDACETTNIDHHRGEINGIDTILLLLTRDAVSTPRMQAEIDFVFKCMTERETLQVIPVLTAGGAWPSDRPELKYVMLDQGEAALAEVRAAVRLPHIISHHETSAYSVLSTRVGQPFEGSIKPRAQGPKACQWASAIRTASR